MVLARKGEQTMDHSLVDSVERARLDGTSYESNI